MFFCAVLGCHQKAPSIPVLSIKNMKEEIVPLPQKKKKKAINWELPFDFVSLFYSFFYIYFPSRHPQSGHMSYIWRSRLTFPPSGSLSSWSCTQLPTIHTYTSLHGGNSPAFPSMNAARCFAEEGFVTLINVPLLHSPGETLLCLPSQSCLHSSKTEKSDILNLSSPKSNQWLI